MYQTPTRIRRWAGPLGYQPAHRCYLLGWRLAWATSSTARTADSRHSVGSSSLLKVASPPGPRTT